MFELAGRKSNRREVSRVETWNANGKFKFSYYNLFVDI